MNKPKFIRLPAGRLCLPVLLAACLMGTEAQAAVPDSMAWMTAPLSGGSSSAGTAGSSGGSSSAGETGSSGGSFSAGKAGSSGGSSFAGKTASSGGEELPSWMTGTLSVQTEEPGGDLNRGPVYRFATDRFLWNVENTMPASFSWISLGKKPTVKSQGALGTCWAISATSAMEAALLPERSEVFSADHLSLSNGFTITQNEGGDYYMIMSYLADWKGPVLESQDPYGDGKTVSVPDAAVHVQEIRLLKGMSQARIKEMIVRFGPVQSSLCMDRTKTDSAAQACYSVENSAYFDPVQETLNHDICVLGWDDSYPKERFATVPEEDGAWICQNTWGEDFGEDGIFYVSYEDANLFRKGGIAYTDVEDADNYDHVYEQDTLGWQARQGYGVDSAYFAGVFEIPGAGELSDGEDEAGADADGGGQQAQTELSDGGSEAVADADAAGAGGQVLSAVGFYATGPSTAYQVYLIRDFQGVQDLEDLKHELRGGPSSGGAGAEDRKADAIAQGWLEHPGYFTVRTDTLLPLSPGERYAVAVFVDTMNGTRPVAVEMAKDVYTQNVTLEGRETYISPDGQAWERTQTVYGTNACLKVYTKDE